MTPTRTSPCSALRASQVHLFETAGNEAHEIVPIFVCKAALSEKLAPTTASWATTSQDEGPVELQKRQIAKPCRNEEVIALEVKYAVKGTVCNNLSTIAWDDLEGILRTSLYDAKCGI